MNILMIGNGFDLVHGLPTRYGDFLKFVEVIRQVLNKKSNEIDWKDIHLEIKKLIEINMGNVENNIFSQEQIWRELLEENVWIDYFLKNQTYINENWIDFESEISKKIQELDIYMQKKDTASSIRNIPFFSKYFQEIQEKKEQERAAELQGKKFEKWINNPNKEVEEEKEEYFFEECNEFKNYKNMISRLEQDLNKLIRALEIYLTEYVEKKVVKCLSPDIVGIEFDKVLSFNYTNTFEKLYDDEQSIEYDYIHGEADAHNTSQTNNMVLGIDEYLGDDRKDKDIELIAFKKFYQRIHKGTGCKYKEWVDDIKEDESVYKENLEIPNSKQIPFGKIDEAVTHHLYIFGHSLDVTDRDILHDLILNDNVYTTIYYRKKYDKEGNDDNGRGELGEKIANLVKVIGQEELIRRTGGSTKTIEFVLQRDMVPV